MTPAQTAALDAQRSRAKLGHNLRRGGTYALAIILAIWILLPIWLITTMAFSTPTDVRAFPKHFFPIPFSTQTLDFFLNTQGILNSTLNSLVVALLALVISTALAIPAGYAIARYLFPGRDAIRLGILSVRAFPIVVLAVPLAVVFIRLGMFDKVHSLAMMHAALTLPTTILVVASVFTSVPREFEEAAQIFGCTRMQAFWRVVLPLAVPGIAAAAILTFVLSWNEVFAAILLTITNRTLPAQILYTLDKSGDPFKFAGGFFMLVPSLIFIFFIRRYLFNMWGQITK
ncbi:MAG: carbohydrate ABC transporter permease [Chloroflexi bacterium]|nr:carbohydrate ABC transporter permease [Chloroflexota bacterium]MDL1883178.1 carbohydrate ABC transporter permease [Anaerolineae bacterium CFX8]